MKKGIIVTGTQGSGKTTKIKDIVSQITTNKVIPISPTRIEEDIHRAVIKEPSVVVIEGAWEINQLETIRKFVKNGIDISDNQDTPLTVFPQIIISTHILSLDELTSFEDDFEIIKVAYQGQANLKPVNSIIEIMDLDRMNATLERLFEGYSSSQMAENDDSVERQALTEDFFNFKRLLKSLEE